MSSDDDDARWLDALAGREPNATDASAREAHMLRAQLLALPELEMREAGTTEAERQASLLGLAQVADLMRHSAPTTPRWRRVTHRRLVLGVAATIALVIGATLTRTPTPPQEIYRGSEQGVVRLQAADPRGLQVQLSNELERAGVQVTQYQQLGRFGVDADLASPVGAKVRALLEAHHIPVPRDGVLAVEIERATP